MADQWPLVPGASVIVTAAVAQRLGPTLVRLAREHQRLHGALDPDVAVTIAAIDRLGRAHAGHDAHTATVPVGIPHREPDGIVGTVSTTTAAERLGITPRAVRARLERGTLPGTRLPTGEWRVWLATDPDLEEMSA